MRRAKLVVLLPVAGAVVGGIVAMIGARWLLVCRDQVSVGEVSAVRGQTPLVLPLLWGVPIGFVVGLGTGLSIAVVRRRGDDLRG